MIDWSYCLSALPAKFLLYFTRLSHTRTRTPQGDPWLLSIGLYGSLWTLSSPTVPQRIPFGSYCCVERLCVCGHVAIQSSVAEVLCEDFCTWKRSWRARSSLVYPSIKNSYNACTEHHVWVPPSKYCKYNMQENVFQKHGLQNRELNIPNTPQQQTATNNKQQQRTQQTNNNNNNNKEPNNQPPPPPQQQQHQQWCTWAQAKWLSVVVLQYRRPGGLRQRAIQRKVREPFGTRWFLSTVPCFQVDLPSEITNIAMENPPIVDVFSIGKGGFSSQLC